MTCVTRGEVAGLGVAVDAIFTLHFEQLFILNDRSRQRNGCALNRLFSTAFQ